MTQDLRLTVYDFIGYLLPGVPTAVACLVSRWALFQADQPLQLPSLSGTGWLLVALACYVLGHVTQGIANLVVSRLGLGDADRLTSRRHSPVETMLLDRAKQLVTTKLEAGKDLPWPAVYGYCDQVVAQRGKTADRELYQYREGFYRGLAVALMILAVSTLAKLATGPQPARIGTHVWAGGTAEWAVLVVFILLMAGMCWRRYVRFLDYRLSNAILGFLVLEDTKATAGEPEE